MTGPRHPPSNSTLGKAVRCPLLEGDLEQGGRCCTCRFLPLARRVAGDDDMAQEVARRLRISTRKSTRSSCVIVLRFGAGLLLRTFVGLVANRAADHSRARLSEKM